MKTHSYVIAKLIGPVTTAHQAQNFNPSLTIDTQTLGPESRRLNFETCICLDSTTPNVPRLHLFTNFCMYCKTLIPEGCCFLFCRIFRHPLYNTGQEWESEHLTVSFPSSSLTLKTPNLYILGSYMIVIYIKVKLICSWEHEENRNRIDWGKHIDWFPIPKPDSIENDIYLNHLFPQIIFVDQGHNIKGWLRSTWKYPRQNSPPRNFPHCFLSTW